MATRLPPLLHPPVGFGRRPPADGETGLERFRSAVNLGATGVAAEVWATADGVPVLHPTGRVGSRFRRRPVADLTARELPADTPTLADLYREVGTDRAVSLDVPDDRVLEVVLGTVRSAGAGAEDNLWLCHPDLTVLTRWRPRTSARLVNAIAVRDADGGLERRAAELEQRGLDGLLLPHKDWSGGRVALLHRFQRLALGWGVVHEREVATLVDTGIDGVYCGHVDRMMAVIAEYYGPAGI